MYIYQYVTELQKRFPEHVFKRIVREEIKRVEKKAKRMEELKSAA